MPSGARTSKRLAGVALASALAVAGFAGVGAANAKTDTYDSYFVDVYTHLQDADNVYETLTYHELRYLFTTPGNYIVLFGGAWSEHTQAVIGHINDVAKEYGITTIYNFDPRLDGVSAAADISDPDNPFPAYRSRWVELVRQNLPNFSPASGEAREVSYSYAVDDAPVTVSAYSIESPYLFVYNRDHGNGETPIVTDLQALLLQADLQTDGAVDPAKVEAYKDQVRAVFDPVAVEVDGRKVVQHGVLNHDDYFRVSYNNATNRTIFEEGEEIVYKPVTYHELQQILQSEGDYLFLFGGAWCSNTQPVIDLVNAWAKEQGITTVYTWDTRLDGGFDPRTGGTTDALHTRQVNRPNPHLYVDLVNEYFPNLVTANRVNPNGNPAEPPEEPSGNLLIWYDTEDGDRVYSGRLQVPYVFTYNKDNVDADGAPAPIFGHVELMYSLNNIVEGHPSGNRDRYIQALNLLGTRLEAVPTGLAGVAPSSASSQDGRIVGVAGALEYKLASAAEYAPVTGDSIDGLAPGTYHVRYAPRTGYNAGATEPADLFYAASQPVEVVVPVPGTAQADAPLRSPAAPSLFDLLVADAAGDEVWWDEEDEICGDTEEEVYF